MMSDPSVEDDDGNGRRGVKKWDPIGHLSHKIMIEHDFYINMTRLVCDCDQIVSVGELVQIIIGPNNNKNLFFRSNTKGGLARFPPDPFSPMRQEIFFCTDYYENKNSQIIIGTVPPYVCKR